MTKPATWVSFTLTFGLLYSTRTPNLCLLQRLKLFFDSDMCVLQTSCLLLACYVQRIPDRSQF